MDEYVGSAIMSGNTRISKVRKFLAKPPTSAVMLRFIAAGEDAEAQAPLAEWQRAEVVPELAAEILAMLDEHTQELGGHVTAQLAFVSGENKVVASLLLKRQANHVVADGGLDTPEAINSQMTGDTRAQSVQAQRHNEVMFRVYMTGMASNLAHSERMVARMGEVVESLASRLGQAERRADTKQAELDALLDALREARDADGPANDNTSPAQERALKLLEAIAPQLLAQLMAPKPASDHRPPPPADKAAAE